MRFIEVEDSHNWDTHNDQIKPMENMTPPTDQTMASLLEDLDQRGLLASTLVVMATEFGRTHRRSATKPPGAVITPAPSPGGSPAIEVFA